MNLKTICGDIKCLVNWIEFNDPAQHESTITKFVQSNFPSASSAHLLTSNYSGLYDTVGIEKVLRGLLSIAVCDLAFQSKIFRLDHQDCWLLDIYRENILNYTGSLHTTTALLCFNCSLPNQKDRKRFNHGSIMASKRDSKAKSSRTTS
jgi:hypothetical protein